jgi:uncharacterized protein
MTSKICFYHYPCADGVTAVWSVIKALPDIKYWGIKPQDDQITSLKYEGKDVIFVDVTPSGRVLKEMLEKSVSVTILDHHISNQKAAEPFIGHPKLNANFDMHRSGCQMAWDHFHLTPSGTSKKRPWFVDYVGDRDLWQFKLEDSRLINMALMELDYINIEGLNQLYKLTKTVEMKEKFLNEKLLPTARVLDMKNEKTLKICMSGACRRVMKIADISYDVWIANGHGHLSSELGNRLMHKKFANNQAPHFVIVYSYKFDDDLWQVSLRSLDIDVSIVAGNFGGGGHKQASGFNYKGNFQDLFTKYIEPK